MSLSKNKTLNVSRDRQEKEKYLMEVLEKLQEEAVRKHNWTLHLKCKAQTLQQELNTINNHLDREAFDVGILTRLISAKKIELTALRHAPSIDVVPTNQAVAASTVASTTSSAVVTPNSQAIVASLSSAVSISSSPALIASNSSLVASASRAIAAPLQTVASVVSPQTVEIAPIIAMETTTISSPRALRKRKTPAKQVEALSELMQIKKRLKQKQQEQLRKMSARMQRSEEMQTKTLSESTTETSDPKKNMLMLNQKMKNLLSTRMVHLQALIAKKNSRKSQLQKVVTERKLEKLPDQRYRPKKMKPVLFEEGVVVVPVSPECLDAIGLIFWSFLESLAVAEWSAESHENAKIENFEDTVEFVSRTTNSKPYCSPLGRLGIRAYRLSEQFLNVFSSLSSLTLSNNIDPKVLFCRYDIQGRCNDDACDWQHMRSIGLRSEQLSQDLAALLGSETSVKVAAACVQDEAAWRKEGKVSRVRMRASKPVVGSVVSDSSKASTADICLPKTNKVEDARAHFEDLVQAEPGSTQHWLAYSKLYKDHEQLAERLKILARAIEVNNHNDILWGEYLRVYAQQARSVDMEQMLAHATTYCSSALQLWVSSARYRTRLQRALVVCKEGVDAQLAHLVSSPLKLTMSALSESSISVVTSSSSSHTCRTSAAISASFNVRGLLTLAATLCCDAGRSEKGKLLLEDWFNCQYTKQSDCVQLAAQLELVDQLGLWLTYVFVVAFNCVPLFIDPFSGLFGSQVWRYGKRTSEWSQMVIAAIKTALSWFNRYASDSETQQQSHKCASILKSHLILVEQLNSSVSCSICREMANDPHHTPQLYLSCAVTCSCSSTASSSSSILLCPSLILHGIAAVSKFHNNSSVWLKFAQNLVEARKVKQAIRLLELYVRKLSNTLDDDDDAGDILTYISSDDSPQIEIAENLWANSIDKGSLPVDTWRCYCLLMSLVKPPGDAQVVYEDSLRDYSARGRDWLWLDFVGYLRPQASKMLISVDRFVSDLLTRSEVRNYTRNQEAEFGSELEHIDAIAPYVICNRIIHLYLAQEHNVHRVSAMYETVCRLLPNNVLLGLSWARYEIERRSARLGRVQQHLYHVAVLFPRIPAVFQCLAQIVLSNGRLELARKYLRNGLEHNPLAASLISDLVQLESTYGDLTAAQSLATDALQRGSKIRPPVSRPTEIL